MDAYLGFAAASGLFWTLTYIGIIRRGFKDQRYGMPLAALSLNISWELIYSVIIPHQGPQRWINLVWFFFDAVILFQVFRYWKNEGFGLQAKAFYSFFLLLIATSFLAVLFIQMDMMNPEFFSQRNHPLGMGRAYSAFLMNLMMSVLFVVFCHQRGSLQGQSLYIALFKFLGTIFADIPFLIAPFPNAAHPGTPAPGELFWPFVYVAIFVFDLIYVIQIYVMSRKQKINPWKRF
ncbi:MAG: hypothetical protein MI717_01035 [Spirochaetales bacterium]|nr:hypothetical protein [Spirochaetales bacterium]